MLNNKIPKGLLGLLARIRKVLAEGPKLSKRIGYKPVTPKPATSTKPFTIAPMPGYLIPSLMADNEKGWLRQFVNNNGYISVEDLLNYQDELPSYEQYLINRAMSSIRGKYGPSNYIDYNLLRSEVLKLIPEYLRAWSKIPLLLNDKGREDWVAEHTTELPEVVVTAPRPLTETERRWKGNLTDDEYRAQRDALHASLLNAIKGSTIMGGENSALPYSLGIIDIATGVGALEDMARGITRSAIPAARAARQLQRIALLAMLEMRAPLLNNHSLVWDPALIDRGTRFKSLTGYGPANLVEGLSAVPTLDGNSVKFYICDKYGVKLKPLYNTDGTSMIVTVTKNTDGTYKLSGSFDSYYGDEGLRILLENGILPKDASIVMDQRINYRIPRSLLQNHDRIFLNEGTLLYKPHSLKTKFVTFPEEKHFDIALERTPELGNVNYITPEEFKDLPDEEVLSKIKKIFPNITIEDVAQMKEGPFLAFAIPDYAVIPKNEPLYHIFKAHEGGHALSIPSEPIPSDVFEIPSWSPHYQYFMLANNTEIAERLSQAKNWYGFKQGDLLTKDHLILFRDQYPLSVVDNNILEMFSWVKDLDKLAEWGNRNAKGIVSLLGLYGIGKLLTEPNNYVEKIL